MTPIAANPVPIVWQQTISNKSSNNNNSNNNNNNNNTINISSPLTSSVSP